VVVIIGFIRTPEGALVTFAYSHSGVRIRPVLFFASCCFVIYTFKLRDIIFSPLLKKLKNHSGLTRS